MNDMLEQDKFIKNIVRADIFVNITTDTNLRYIEFHIYF